MLLFNRKIKKCCVFQASLWLPRSNLGKIVFFDTSKKILQPWLWKGEKFDMHFSAQLQLVWLRSRNSVDFFAKYTPLSTIQLKLSSTKVYATSEPHLQPTSFLKTLVYTVFILLYFTGKFHKSSHKTFCRGMLIIL